MKLYKINAFISSTHSVDYWVVAESSDAAVKLINELRRSHSGYLSVEWFIYDQVAETGITGKPNVLLVQKGED